MAIASTRINLGLTLFDFCNDHVRVIGGAIELRISLNGDGASYFTRVKQASLVVRRHRACEAHRQHVDIGECSGCVVRHSFDQWIVGSGEVTVCVEVGLDQAGTGIHLPVLNRALFVRRQLEFQRSGQVHAQRDLEAL